MLMLCESFNYFSLSLLFVLYLTQEFGVGDVEVSCLAIYVTFPALPLYCRLLQSWPAASAVKYLSNAGRDIVWAVGYPSGGIWHCLQHSH